MFMIDYDPVAPTSLMDAKLILEEEIAEDGGRRRSLMPIDGAHPLPAVLEAAGEHAKITGHAPMLAYTLLAGHNDGDDDAASLADLVLGFARDHGVRPRLSLPSWQSAAFTVGAEAPSGQVVVHTRYGI